MYFCLKIIYIGVQPIDFLRSNFVIFDLKSSFISTAVFKYGFQWKHCPNNFERRFILLNFNGDIFRLDGNYYHSLRNDHTEHQKVTISPSLRYPNYQSMPRNYGRSNSSNNLKGKSRGQFHLMTSSPIMTSYMLWILNLIIYQDRSDYGQSDVRYWIRELASWWRHRLFQCFLSHYTLGETSFDSPKYKGSRFSLTSNPEDKEEVSTSISYVYFLVIDSCKNIHWSLFQNFSTFFFQDTDPRQQEKIYNGENIEADFPGDFLEFQGVTPPMGYKSNRISMSLDLTFRVLVRKRSHDIGMRVFHQHLAYGYHMN